MFEVRVWLSKGREECGGCLGEKVNTEPIARY